MAKAKTSDIFEVEREELLPAVETDDSMFNDDSSGDPEGAERRATPDAVQVPDYFYKKYGLTTEGVPTFNPAFVDQIMTVFEAKRDSAPNFADDGAQQEYNDQVQLVARALKALCDVDPQTTGIQALSLNTRTWAEFASISAEYMESAESCNPNEELPTWLIEREDKMIKLGRTARLVRDAILEVDNRFGLKSIGLDTKRVKNEVERRLQRLAEWNYNNVVDTSLKSAMDLNVKSKEHTKSVFDLA